MAEKQTPPYLPPEPKEVDLRFDMKRINHSSRPGEPSNIHSIARSQSGHLAVVFTPRKSTPELYRMVYIYQPITSNEWLDLLQCQRKHEVDQDTSGPSVGQYFARQIRPNYKVAEKRWITTEVPEDQSDSFDSVSFYSLKPSDEQVEFETRHGTELLKTFEARVTTPVPPPKA